MIWRSFKERPNAGTSVVGLELHWKKQGYKSVDILGGEVQYWEDYERANGTSGPIWAIWNCDERGKGAETWTAGEDFQWWAYEVDMPELPKEGDDEY